MFDSPPPPPRKPATVQLLSAPIRPSILILGVIAIAAAVAVPNLHTTCGCGNESAAISTLRNISSAQAQFHASSVADLDGDGTGEYGCFLEMSGGTAIRGALDAPMIVSIPPKRCGMPAPASPAQVAVLDPPVLSGAFRTLTAHGAVARSGYHFRIYLTANGGDAVCEAPGVGLQQADLDVDAAETIWCAYAWPVSYGTSGNRTFFVNQVGDILATDCAAYSGAAGPTPGAAFLDGGRETITGTAVTDETHGQDGQLWTQVN